MDNEFDKLGIRINIFYCTFNTQGAKANTTYSLLSAINRGKEAGKVTMKNEEWMKFKGTSCTFAVFKASRKATTIAPTDLPLATVGSILL